MRQPFLYLSSAAASSFFDSSLSLAMSIRPRFRPSSRGGRGGRGQWRRDYSEGPLHPGTSENQFVAGGSHFQSVRATDSGFQEPVYSHNYNNYPCNGNDVVNYGRFRGQSYSHRPRPDYSRTPPPDYSRTPPPDYSRTPQPDYSRTPPPDYCRTPLPDYSRTPPPDYGFRPHFSSYQRPQQPHHQLQPRRPKPNDHRRWEAAENPPPPTCERFSVLSYNILADYLANNHRGKLYYHIPRRFMDWEWRRKGIIFELGLWSPDIMCFQEVDRFNDLEEALRNRGYLGIWKMRTGNPVDGCAMFWRTSRFKLVHEEHIEFNKLGMRDNVAQICVLESLVRNDIEGQSTSSKSPTGPNKVVICNIHVLYNPRRGEIKLGQVRVLLEKAQAVSKIWNDAPVVICGDFNCTPKSPLYNFITHQKLDLSELDRDKVSGQASAEIPSQSREFRPHSGVISNTYSVPTPAVVVNMGSNSEHDASSEKQLHLQNYSANEFPATALLEKRDKVDPESSSAKVAVETSQEAVDFSRNETGAASCVSNDHLKYSQNDSSANTLDPAASKEEIGSSCTERNQEERATPSQSEIYVEEQGMNGEMDKSPTTPDSFSSDEVISEELASTSTPVVAKASTILEGNTSDTSLAIEFDVGEKFEGLSLEELDENGEDSDKFLSDLHLGDAILEDMSPRINSESLDMERSTYDPSLWTPMEIATATGNADCTLLQHPLKLRSTYAEVEGSSETRQSSGEPVLTSYNKCFMGTVDYIWRTEGLQTLRVLAPLPKSAVQWTQGFPTRKWGSDHIALVSELAFTKDSE